MQNRIFYVTFLEQEPLRSGIDAIRLLANPSERLRTHITLRGPYEKEVSGFPRIDRMLANCDMAVHGVGCYFERYQNTVFWDVHEAMLRTAMKKRDFPTGKPHLTIYDGDSRKFGSQLLKLFTNRDVSFTFRPSKLSPIYSSGGQGSFDIWVNIDKPFVSGILSYDFSRPKVLALNVEERLNAINLILDAMIRLSLIHVRTPSSSEANQNILLQPERNHSSNLGAFRHIKVLDRRN
jgi:hypothetical protein